MWCMASKGSGTFGVWFKCVVNSTPAVAQVEKFTYTTNYRRQKESGRRSCLNTRRNEFNGPDKEVILCNIVNVQEIVWDCLIQAILPTPFWPVALGIQEYPFNRRLAQQPNISHFITTWKCCWVGPRAAAVSVGGLNSEGAGTQN